MKATIRNQRIAKIHARLLLCDCGRPGTHLDSGCLPECDHCQALNRSAEQWHMQTAEQTKLDAFLALPFEEREAIEQERARKRCEYHRHYNHYVRARA